jgi:RNA polymerase sigma-70 factor (ECF subfamily)
MVYRYFLQHGAREDAEDLTQETFVAVYRRLDGYDGVGRFESWLFKVAQNTLRRHRRDATVAKRGGNVEPLPLVADPRVATDHPAAMAEPRDPLDRLLQGEGRRLVESALAKLPDQMRTCLSLYLFKEYRQNEIAELLQVSLSTVKTQISRGRSRLLELLPTRLAGPKRRKHD